MLEDPIEQFLALSAVLTGFSRADLLGTGVAHEYYHTMVSVVGERIAGEILAAGADAIVQSLENDGDAEDAVRGAIILDPKFGPVATNIINMWYLGLWTHLPHQWRNSYGGHPKDVDRVVSARAYTESLVWRAIGTHPPAAKQPGYGTWGLEPRFDPISDISDFGPET